MFETPIEHLQAELHRLDLLLHREILRLRASYQLSLDEFRGLYVSDEQVDQLLRQRNESGAPEPAVGALTQQAEAMRHATALRISAQLPWVQLVREFALSPDEADLLLLALAPEIDPKYETLYAYLNNDVSRKWPTRDLALRLLGTDLARKTELRAALLPGGALFQTGLLRPLATSPERPSWLTGGFSAAPLVTHFVLGLPPQDPLLIPYVTVVQPARDWEDLPFSEGQQSSLRRIPDLFRKRSGPPLIFQGRFGTGHRAAAEAVCGELGVPLLQVDLANLLPVKVQWGALAQSIALLARLTHAGVYLDHGEALFESDGSPVPAGRELLGPLQRLKGPLFYACPPDLTWHGLFDGEHCIPLPFGEPDYSVRRRLWSSYAAQASLPVAPPALDTLASRFILTPGQIRNAIAIALDRQKLCEDPTQPVQLEQMLEAARSQSDQSLGRLAVKVFSRYTWDDLVLPTITLRQLKQIAAAIRNHSVVYHQWCFGQRTGSGNGLKVLFSGASGTGKTMTVGIIARDLGLDLYRIDLSGIVSKYIGETEKNLDRIFSAARSSNAILFFDEADALFGKRSEVKDAHDRYANIEVAYLLQKIEEHEGPVILASNLSINIDQAFSRRMQYVVEFPQPDVPHREKLWRGMFPKQAPLGGDVDFAFLAAQFQIAGGDIKNVALDAAFLAAQDGRVVTMKQLINAMARQMSKQGRIPSASEFKQYHALIVHN